MNLDVIILAGAPNNGPLKKISGTEHEALIKIDQIPMVEYVLKAVNQAEYTGRVVVVGPKKEMEEAIQEKADLFVEAAYTLEDNILRGISALEKRSDYLLIMTSDIPLITAEAIDKYVEACLQDGKADLYYPIIPKERNLEKFPTSRRTYFQLAEGIFTGGNMVIVKPDIFTGNRDLLEKVIAWRKKPWKLSRLLGIKFIFRFVTGNLSIVEIEDKVAKITGYKGHFMITEDAEIGFDVDKPSDLEIMMNTLIS
ncbi:MAG TPA: nucleotidyltransferase family protein [Halanaerobiales bacterium]|mgnify:CR=1 FL=1|nr:nucleotidyltransferase family protein [Bacillota bacterium]HOA40059.1 nucleotidyltransferase family protein [Halanaerobiales bacterium]HPZ62135.1 nucleotidyltransferase family protein [Halanaerobiales bacterium]HQD03368.1 nucleotidyltransferase family protein [Halanaerobiales bacterium]